jgi:FkbM family methyltransferase
MALLSFLPDPVSASLRRALLPRLMRVEAWWLLLRRLRAPSAVDGVRLIGSALADLAVGTLSPGRAPSPRTRFAGRVMDRTSGAWFHFRAHTDDLYNALPGGEQDVHDAILGVLRPGDVFLDVGANVGYYSVLGALRVGVLGRVLAFEATPPTAVQLRKNLEANGLSQVEVIEAAVTDGRARWVRLGVPAHAYGMASVTRANDAGVESFRVPAVTLADAAADIASIRMVKIDIEGGELAALRGAEPILNRVEHLVVECNVEVEEIAALLRAHGFEVEPLRFGPYVRASRRPGESGPGTTEVT